MADSIYVTVGVKDGLLVLATSTDEIVDGILYPAGDGRLGPVLMDSAKHLGVREDAIPVLRQLFQEAGCDGDGFGDIDWWQTDDGRCCFAWLGPNIVAWDPVNFRHADRSREARFRDSQFVLLPATKEE